MSEPALTAQLVALAAGTECTIGQFLENLDLADRALFDSLFRVPRKYSGLHRILTAQGLDIDSLDVPRHARHECTCPVVISR